jgi:hypothetical protein
MKGTFGKSQKTKIAKRKLSQKELHDLGVEIKVVYVNGDQTEMEAVKEEAADKPEDKELYVMVMPHGSKLPDDEDEKLDGYSVSAWVSSQLCLQLKKRMGHVGAKTTAIMLFGKHFDRCARYYRQTSAMRAMGKCVKWWKYRMDSSGYWMRRVRYPTTPICVKYVCTNKFCRDFRGCMYRGTPCRGLEQTPLLFEDELGIRSAMCWWCDSSCEWQHVGALVTCPTDDWMSDEVFAIMNGISYQGNRIVDMGSGSIADNVWYVSDHMWTKFGDELFAEISACGGSVKWRYFDD